MNVKKGGVSDAFFLIYMSLNRFFLCMGHIQSRDLINLFDSEIGCGYLLNFWSIW